MPEQLPAPSSVAGLASPVQRLHHPKPEEHALLCSALLDSGGKERKKKRTRREAAPGSTLLPFIECPDSSIVLSVRPLLHVQIPPRMPVSASFYILEAEKAT
jgi:hypothetical protein